MNIVSGSHGQVNTNGPRVIVDADNGDGPTEGFKPKYFLRASRILFTVVSGSQSQVNTNGPRVIVDAGNGVGPTGGFITSMSKSYHVDRGLW